MPNHDRPPLVLAVCIDAMRYDCVNWQPETPYFQKFGMTRRLNTPTLDALAAECVRFPRAISHAGYTPLSLATTLTGTYARMHGVVDFQNTTCRSEVASLPQLFKRAGYRTCTVCGPEFFTSLGLTRDVDHTFRDERPLLDLLEGDPDTPTFAFVHFNEVHSPYAYFYDDAADNRDFELMMWLLFGLQVDLATREYVDNAGRRVGFDKWDQIIAAPVAPAAQHDRALSLFKCYLHGLQKFDQTRLRRFTERLSAAGLWDGAVAAFFADHGEIVSPRLPWALGHGKFLLEQLQRVPLMIRAPGLVPHDVRPLVGLVDLAPTLLELAGCGELLADTPYALDGRSLLPAIEHDRPVQPDYYQEGWSVLVAEQRERPVLYQRAIRTQDDVKYLFTGDLMVENELDALAEEDYLAYVIERALGEIAYPGSRATLQQHLSAGVPRARLAALAAGQMPRYRRFELRTDPFEERGHALAPDHAGWEEYLVQLQRMATLRGRPNYATSYAAVTDAQQAAMLKHLAELGYVEV